MCRLLTQAEPLPVWLWKAFMLNLLIPLQDRSCWVSSRRGKMGPTSHRQICLCFPKVFFHWWTSRNFQTCALIAVVVQMFRSWDLVGIWWYLQTYINTVFQIRSGLWEEIFQWSPLTTLSPVKCPNWMLFGPEQSQALGFIRGLWKSEKCELFFISPF